MENLKDLQKIIADLDEATLAALEDSLREARREMLPKVDIDSIRPGMTADEIARTRAEIVRVLAGR
jgi:hypothetical protein